MQQKTHKRENQAKFTNGLEPLKFIVTQFTLQNLPVYYQFTLPRGYIVRQISGFKSWQLITVVTTDGSNYYKSSVRECALTRSS